VEDGGEGRLVEVLRAQRVGDAPANVAEIAASFARSAAKIVDCCEDRLLLTGRRVEPVEQAVKGALSESPVPVGPAVKTMAARSPRHHGKPYYTGGTNDESEHISHLLLVARAAARGTEGTCGATIKAQRDTPLRSVKSASVNDADDER